MANSMVRKIFKPGATGLDTKGVKAAVVIPDAGFPGREMLESGSFADAKVICQDKTWDVSRIILCGRSAWFKAALGGPFQEGLNREVEITDFSPEDVQRLLEFAYSGRIENPNWDEAGGKPLLELNRLAVLADYFQMEHMGEGVVRLLADYLGSIIDKGCAVTTDPKTILEWNIERGLVDGLVHAAVDRFYRALWTDTPIDMIWEAIRDAYARPGATQHVYVDFVYAARIHTFKDEQLQTLVRDIPDFGQDLALAMIGGPLSHALRGSVFDWWADGLSNRVEVLEYQAVVLCNSGQVDFEPVRF